MENKLTSKRVDLPAMISAKVKNFGRVKQPNIQINKLTI